MDRTTGRTGTFRRYAGIYAALWKNSLTREMIFKANFLMWLVVEFLWFGLQLVFVGVLYLHTETIGTWTKWQVVMLIGASHFIQQIFQAFFLVNCTNLSELVRLGKLDFILLLPANTRFIVSLRQVDLGGFVNAASALGVMVYAATRMGLVPGPVALISFFLLCVAGILIHYSLMFLIASISFWTVRAQGIVWGYYNFFQVARLPDEAFRGFFKAFFTFAVPMLLVSNVPVRVLVEKNYFSLSNGPPFSDEPGVFPRLGTRLALLAKALYKCKFVIAFSNPGFDRSFVSHLNACL